MEKARPTNSVSDYGTCSLALIVRAPQICSSQSRPWLSRMLFGSCALVALAFGTIGAQAGVTEKAFIRTPENATVVWGPGPDFLPKGCGLAVLHGDPAKQNADVLLKVPGGSVLAHHKHTSPERIILISGEMTVRYDGQHSPCVFAPAPMPTARPICPMWRRA